MDMQQYGELIRQHVELVAKLDQLWAAFIILILLGLMFLVSMLLAAAWSVHTVNKRQLSLEGKFNLLIDVLLQTEKNRREKDHG